MKSLGRLLPIIAASIFLSSPCYALGQADIALTDITVDNACIWTIAAKNVGPTQLPVTAMDQYNGAYITISINGTSIGFWRFGQQLKMPGNVEYFTLGNAYYNPAAVVNGSATISATFHTNSTYTDVNLANNSLTKTLVCTAPTTALPDPAILAVDFTADCRPHVVVGNLGTTAIDSVGFNSIYLQRNIDGLSAGQLYLRQIDPAGGIKNSGSRYEWTDTADYLPQAVISYSIRSNGVIKDSNFNNNSATAQLPDRCKQGAAAIRKPVPSGVQPNLIHRDMKPLPRFN